MHVEALLDVVNGHKVVRKNVKNTQKISQNNVILIRGVGDPSVVNHAFVDLLCQLCALPMPRGVVKAAVIVVGRIIRYRHIHIVSMMRPSGVMHTTHTPVSVVSICN